MLNKLIKIIRESKYVNTVKFNVVVNVKVTI